MRFWIKDCFCSGLSYSLAGTSWIGKWLVYGRRTKEKTQVREVLFGFIVGAVSLIAVLVGIIFGV